MMIPVNMQAPKEINDKRKRKCKTNTTNLFYILKARMRLIWETAAWMYQSRFLYPYHVGICSMFVIIDSCLCMLIVDVTCFCYITLFVLN